MSNIRTLKDLKIRREWCYNCKRWIIPHEFHGREDFKKHKDSHSVSVDEIIDAIDLRRAAIEWVKESLNKSKGTLRIEEIGPGNRIKFLHHNTGNPNQDPEYDHYLQGRIDVLVNFFNLAESDLKEESKLGQELSE